MYLCVSGCEYLDNGSRRIYHLNNTSMVVECPALPGKLRLRFYDGHNRTVYTNQAKAAMRSAVERHKKQRGIR